MPLMPVSVVEAAAVPPELDYVEFTGQVDCTATTEATADTVVTGNPIVFDGSTVCLVEFYVETYTLSLVTIDGFLSLYDGASSIGRMFQGRTIVAAAGATAIYAVRRLTPAAGSHTYSARGFVSSAGTFSVFGGAGGNGNRMPGFLRVSRAT